MLTCRDFPKVLKKLGKSLVFYTFCVNFTNVKIFIYKERTEK